MDNKPKYLHVSKYHLNTHNVGDIIQSIIGIPLEINF